MSIITLTTDWGDSNHYKGAIKGLILKNLPTTQIVDISHSIKPFDFIHAACVIKNSYHYFPENTVHMIAVDADIEPHQPHCIIKHNNHFFIGKDNGIFSLMFDCTPQEIIHITNHRISTFPAKDVFCNVAIELLSGKDMSEFGDAATTVKQITSFNPVISEHQIVGTVLYIDQYHNLITNIDKTLFYQHKKDRQFNILFRDKQFDLKKINTTYNESREADIFAIFGENGLLEIGVHKGKADELLGMYQHASIIIQWKEE